MAILAKSPQQRVADTLLYIRSVTSPAFERIVGTQLARLDPVWHPPIQQAMSFGGGPALLRSANETLLRRAVRAVVLTESTIGSHPILSLAGLNAILARETKVQLDRRLQDYAQRMSIAATGTLVSLAEATSAENRQTMPGWNNTSSVDYAGWRVGQPPPEGFNCYTALVYWAFQARLITHRFLATWKAACLSFPDSVASCAKLLKIEGGPADERRINEIPAGRTVVFTRVGNHLGHTVLSLGGGLCASQNELGKQFKSDNVAEWEKARNKKAHVVPLSEFRDHVYASDTGYSFYVSGKPFWEAIPHVDR